MLSHVPLGKGRPIAPSCRAWAISSGRNVFLEQGFEGALYGAPPHLSEAVWLSQLGRLAHHDSCGLSTGEVVNGVELPGGVVAEEEARVDGPGHRVARPGARVRAIREPGKVARAFRIPCLTPDDGGNLLAGDGIL